MAEIDNILATLKKQEVEYDLGTSDFAVTIDDAKNGTVDVQLLQRNFKLVSCIIVGNNSIPKDTKGIVLFVSKSKYPCFIPFYFGTNSSSNEHKKGSFDLTTFKTNDNEEYPKEGFVNLRDYLKSVGLSEGVHFKYRASSPYSEQWGTRSTVISILNIIKDWYNYTKGNSLFIPGDIAVNGGGKYGPHSGRGHATGRAIDCYTTNGLEIASNINSSNQNELFALLDILFNYGVVGIMWQPNKPTIDRYGSNRVIWDSNHGTHFHVSFINLPF